MDNRQLNKVTKPNEFTVPKDNECIDAVSGVKIAATLQVIYLD